MNYGEIRDASLQLINQYTIAGSVYSPSYNNQQDYLNKIPFLINDCLMYIASTVHRYPSQVTLDPAKGEEYGNYLRFTFPDDLLEMIPGGLLVPTADKRRGESSIWTRYKVEPPDHILLPRNLDKPVVLPYYRRPQLLPFSGVPADDTVIDAPVQVQMAIPYYVAAHLVMEDDSFRYASLYNEFANKMDRLVPAPYTEIQEVCDVYGGFDGEDGFYV